MKFDGVDPHTLLTTEAKKWGVRLGTDSEEDLGLYDNKELKAVEQN